MIEAIQNFVNAFQAALEFFRDFIFAPIGARAELLWEDFDNWLIDHGWTLSQFIGYIFAAILSFVALGVLIMFWGLLLGNASVNAAAFWITFAIPAVGLGVLTFFTWSSIPEGSRRMWWRILLVVLCAYTAINLLTTIIDLAAAGSEQAIDAFFEAARRTVLFGGAIPLLVMAPIMALYFLARKLFQVIFSTGEIACELLDGEDDRRKKISARLRAQLAAYRNTSSLTDAVRVGLALYLFAALVCVAFPYTTSAWALLYFGVAFTIVLIINKQVGAKGFVLQRALTSGPLSLLIFTVPAYWAVGMFLQSEGVRDHIFHVSNLAQWNHTVKALQVICAAVLFVLSFVLFFIKSRVASEENALDTGDVPRDRYRKRVHVIDAQGHPHWEAYDPKHDDHGHGTGSKVVGTIGSAMEYGVYLIIAVILAIVAGFVIGDLTTVFQSPVSSSLNDAVLGLVGFTVMFFVMILAFKKLKGGY